ncbi:MAG TPA: hypothetical protein H9903_20785 [Candidatus Aquabacterium excrementipullorum]|nr:hypothetical protein [Candidatus Aquabacterium excrementipullorum]
MKWPAAWMMAALPLLPACVFVPRTTQVYDPECRIVSQKMEMQPVQVASIHACRDSGCGVLLAAAGATAVASAVISGSIVIVGNVVYWLEKQGRCERSAPLPPARPG